MVRGQTNARSQGHLQKHVAVSRRGFDRRHYTSLAVGCAIGAAAGSQLFRNAVGKHWYSLTFTNAIVWLNVRGG